MNAFEILLVCGSKIWHAVVSQKVYIFNNLKTVEQTSNKLISNKYLVPEAYSEPCQRFKMELFAKLVNGFHL